MAKLIQAVYQDLLKNARGRCLERRDGMIWITDRMAMAVIMWDGYGEEAAQRLLDRLFILDKLTVINTLNDVNGPMRILGFTETYVQEREKKAKEDEREDEEVEE